MSKSDRSRTPQENLQLTHRGPWELTEIEPPTKEHPQAGPRPHHTFVAHVQLSLHVVLLTIRVGAVSDTVACRRIPFP